MNKKPFLILALSAALGFSSCEKDDKDEVAAPASLRGMFIVNEGAFGGGNAGVSFYSADSNYSVTDLFSVANPGQPVGDILQSMTMHNGKAYLCVNNSQTIRVVSMKDFKQEAVINSINNPRYFTAISNTLGAVSDWAENKVAFINLSDNTVSGFTATGSGPEEMLFSNNRLFVCNSGGFTGEDSTVSVVDVNTKTVTETIKTGLYPGWIRKDKNGKIWILCKGSYGTDFVSTADDIGGQLLRINPTTLQVEASFNFPQDQHPSRLQINKAGNNLYYLSYSGYLGGALYRMNINDANLPSSPIIDGEYYGFGIDPRNENITLCRPSFSTNSVALRYSASGILIDSLSTGIGPNAALFNF
jgi:YVTN family beta-propeller protein